MCDGYHKEHCEFKCKENDGESKCCISCDSLKLCQSEKCQEIKEWSLYRK